MGWYTAIIWKNPPLLRLLPRGWKYHGLPGMQPSLHTWKLRKKKDSTPEMMCNINCHIIPIILINVMMREAESATNFKENPKNKFFEVIKQVLFCHISRLDDSSRWFIGFTMKVHLHECVIGHINYTLRVQVDIWSFTFFILLVS